VFRNLSREASFSFRPGCSASAKEALPNPLNFTLKILWSNSVQASDQNDLNRFFPRHGGIEILPSTPVDLRLRLVPPHPFLHFLLGPGREELFPF